MLDLIAVGDVMLDVLGPPGGGTPVHAPIRVRAGGSAVNVARQAVAAGYSAAVVGRIGDDVAGRAITEELATVGIEPRLAVDTETPTGCLAALGAHIVADRGANARISAGDVTGLDARIVVVSGYLLFHSSSRAAALTALEIAANDDGTLSCIDLAAARLVQRADDLDRLIGAADIITGDAATIEAAGGLERLAAGRRAVAATLGADGALGAAGSERASGVPPVRLSHSPWGAGDAFLATFVLSLAGGATLGDALGLACAAGAAPAIGEDPVAERRARDRDDT
jgi:sugar/nucleoside kinase (ribokinase family)